MFITAEVEIGYLFRILHNAVLILTFCAVGYSCIATCMCFHFMDEKKLFSFYMCFANSFGVDW